MSDRPQIQHVFLNGRFLTQRVTGVQRYARETLAGIDEILAAQGQGTCRWTLVVPSGTEVPPLRAISVDRIGRLHGHLWEQLSLPRHVRGALLVNFGFTGPMVKANQVATFHDAALVRVPQTYAWQFRLWNHLVIGILARRIRRVFTVSQFGAAEVGACFGVEADRMRVMTEGWQHLERVVPDDSILDRHDLRGRHFALAVSSPTPSKNFSAIVKAMHLMGDAAPRFVVVGSLDPSVFKAGRHGGSQSQVGYVTDGELKALYQHATCFVFPSLYEGFGIPPLEAMSCRCPVVSSDVPALRETCGDAPLYFDPLLPTELAAALHRVFNEPDLRASMRQAGTRRAECFSWRRAATLNIAAIQELM